MGRGEQWCWLPLARLVYMRWLKGYIWHIWD